MMTEPVGLAQMKARTGTTWEAGEFAAVTRRQLRSADRDLMHRVGIGAS
jgi:hypothetical protein